MNYNANNGYEEIVWLYLKYNIVFNDTVVEDLSHFSWPHVVSNDNGYGKNTSSQTSEQDQIERGPEAWYQYIILEVDLQWWIVDDNQPV
jgi:hypothetical protein